MGFLDSAKIIGLFIFVFILFGIIGVARDYEFGYATFGIGIVIGIIAFLGGNPSGAVAACVFFTCLALIQAPFKKVFFLEKANNFLTNKCTKAPSEPYTLEKRLDHMSNPCSVAAMTSPEFIISLNDYFYNIENIRGTGPRRDEKMELNPVFKDEYLNWAKNNNLGVSTLSVSKFIRMHLAEAYAYDDKPENQNISGRFIKMHYLNGHKYHPIKAVGKYDYIMLYLTVAGKSQEEYLRKLENNSREIGKRNKNYIEFLRGRSNNIFKPY